MKRNLFIAGFASALLMPPALSQQSASGQRTNCPGGVCYPENRWGPSGGARYVRPVEPKEAAVAADQAAHCRVFVGDGSTGSGTLIDRDDKTGLVLTCSHLFDDSSADAASIDVIVSFPNGARYGGRLIGRDRANDLAAVLIQCPAIEPIPFDDAWQASSSPAPLLTACGFGAQGQFRPVSGPISGMVQATGATDPSVKIVGTVRPGDSGGGVLNRAGRLVGVVWGCRDGETYLTCGRPLREFVGSIWRGRRRGSNAAVQDSDPQETERNDASHNDASDFSDEWATWRAAVDARVTKLEALDHDSTSRIESLRAALHTRIEERIGGILPALAETAGESHPGFVGGLSYGKLLAGALGVSGPVALAVILAGGLAGRRISRGRASSVERREPEASRVSSRQPIAVDSPPPRQQTVPETHYVPVEKDDFARAHQWASEQVARKYPGATELLSTLDSLIKQQLVGKV